MFIRTKPGFLFAAVCLILSLSCTAYAELEGMWRVEHPELGGVYFRIKSDKSCSYFLEKGTNTVIFKGKWEEIPTGVELQFDNGVVFSIGELKPGIIDVRMDLSSEHDVGSGMVVSKGELIQSQAIGKLTVNPDKGDDDEDRNGYFGAWEGELISGKKIYFMIKEDRTSGLSYSFSSPSDTSETEQIVGYWKKDGEKLQVIWNDGSFTMFETNGRRIEQTSFKGGELLEEAKGFTCRITPISEKDLPEEWYKAFNKDYVARMPIIVLRQVSHIKSFFRGDWIIGNSTTEGNPYVVELKRFGNAWTNRYGGVKGDWYPNSDSVTMIWRNGVKESLSPVGNQFLIKSFNPDQPVSGRPARIETANPIDQDKIGYYVNRKTELLDPTRFLKKLKSKIKKDKEKEKKEE